MNQIPRFITRSLAFLLVAGLLSSSSTLQFPARAQSTTAAHTALRTAVAANNEAALQRVETEYANSEEAALAVPARQENERSFSRNTVRACFKKGTGGG